MTNQWPATAGKLHPNDERLPALIACHSDLFRHSNFVIRHSFLAI